MQVTEFVKLPLVAALIERYRAGLASPGADTGALRAAIEQEFVDRQREQRSELRDYLDAIASAPGGPRSDVKSSFGHRRRP